MDPLSNLPHLDISLKILLALGVGLLVGLEREFAAKDVGLRSFSFAAVFGLLSQIIGPAFTAVGLACVLCVVIFMNGKALLQSRSLEITTSIALLITYCLGVLVGFGHVFTPVSVSILVTLLLAWKAELAAFAHGLKLFEIRSAVMLGLLTFVIYPLLPDQFVDPWDLVNPKEAWITVIVLSGISFVNYIFLTAYSTKGLYYSALLGGAVNSSAAVTEIAEAIKTSGEGIRSHAIPILLMTTISMFMRNLFLLGVFDRNSIYIALAPLLAMIATATFFVYRAHLRREKGVAPSPPLEVSSPVELKRVLKFAFLFVTIQAAGTLSQRYLGSAGVLVISFLGGFVSSASTTAAAAKLASHGMVTASLAGIATVITSISSAFVNLPIVLQITKDKALTRNLGFTTFACIVVGLASMGAVAWIEYLWF
jgi:uncharacterized membrane protein (DUF4010 family)